MNQNEKPTALVLGGTNPHVNLIRKLKARGYYVVLADYLPNPSGKTAADYHVQESTLDKEAILRVAKEYKVDLVITTNIDQANVTACYVAEKLGLPRPYSYDTSLNVTDKERMKKIMQNNKIPTAQYIVINNFDLIERGGVKYPFVIKPTDSKGSRGVHRCDSKEDAKRYFEDACSYSSSHKVIVEELVEGVEVSYYYFIQNGKTHYITSNQRIRFRKGTKGVIQSIGGIYPAALGEMVDKKMMIIAQNIATAFELQNTPVFIQAIVDKNQNIKVLEFAPRIGGGLSYRVIEKSNQFDIIDATINSFLGICSEINIEHKDNYAAVMNIYAGGAVMGGIHGAETAVEDGLAQEFYQYKMRGSNISDDMSSGSRVGAFLLEGENVSDIYQKIKSINRKVEVTDIEGNKIMQHDVYSDL